MSTASAKQSTRDRVSAGGRVVRVILSPDAAKALDSLRERHGVTMTEVIDSALRLLHGQNWGRTAAPPET